MKKHLLFLLLSVFLFACNNDEDLANELSYDRGENDAPFLDAGEYIAAALFPASTVSDYQGQALGSIEYYLVNTPTQCELRVYQGTSNGEPVDLVYSATVTTEMEANSWNEHTLPTPLSIDGDDLWISVRFVLNDRDQTIGCDVGPASNNGDWILSVNGGWETFRSFTANQVNINWNIRGNIIEL